MKEEASGRSPRNNTTNSGGHVVVVGGGGRHQALARENMCDKKMCPFTSSSVRLRLVEVACFWNSSLTTLAGRPAIKGCQPYKWPTEFDPSEVVGSTYSIHSFRALFLLVNKEYHLHRIPFDCETKEPRIDPTPCFPTSLFLWCC